MPATIVVIRKQKLMAVPTIARLSDLLLNLCWIAKNAAAAKINNPLISHRIVTPCVTYR
jgi:hypothetical protein